MSKKIEKPQLINLTLLSHFKSKIDELLNNKVNKTDIASYENLGISKPDGSTILVSEDGVLSSVATSNVQEKELLLSEYQALSKEEKNNDTNYYITDADNIDDVSSVGTAGSLKPWLYNSNEEVVIGVYNGKPLYRKMFNMSVTCSANYFAYYKLVDYMDNANDIEKIVNYSAYIPSIGSVVPKIFAVSTGISEYNASLIIESATQIVVSTGKQITFDNTLCEVTIEYTKTTDAENSGVNLMPYTYVQNASNNYSTEEQVVGRWIDGKPLYQKTYDITGISLTANIWFHYPIEIENLESVLKIEGNRVNADKKHVYSMDGINTDIAQGMKLIYNGFDNAISFVATKDNANVDTHYFVTIQYTKTTD